VPDVVAGRIPGRILGIDPGSAVTGWGVVEVKGTSHRLIDAGAIVTPDDALPERLLAIHRGLQEVIRVTRPAAAAVESLFFAKNVRSAIRLGQARGVALLTIAEAELPLSEYAPMEIKRALVGTGRAEKTQVAHMVRLLLGPSVKALPNRLDVTDALGVAICHAHYSAARVKLAGAR